ncbi:MAG: hypothetical protein L0Y44_14170 [Phycisphaerales bacterium]|nr:hypothetical protein [Phycisphaerales bacterium]MCI0631788.1 hypothetical protein [Phycisphaerales bacterium]
MPNIARTTPQPAVHASPAAKTKVLLVRQPVKSVRKSDEPDRTMIRIVVGVITALGTIATVWLIGHLGYRLGFAPMMRVPELSAPGGQALANGTFMLISMPRVILQAGIDQPMWLMLGFALIAIPAATLGAIGPTAPGGPRPKPAAVFLAMTGAVAAGLNAIALLWWTVSPFRSSLLRQLPFDPSDAAAWLDNLQTVSGLDVLGVIAAALWVVVAMRLPIPLWLRGVSASACLFSLIVAAVAMSMSNAAVAQIIAPRSVCILDEPATAAGSQQATRLVIGFTPRALATLHVTNNRTVIELRDRPAVLEVIAAQSIVDYLNERAIRE